ncbi:MAG: hypothetical protein PHE16_06100 [Aliarcobacter sp.]|nr:hypothetical protein [Aliarcobacter sp.]
MEEQIEFDFNEILNQFRNGKKLTGKDGLLAPLIKYVFNVNLSQKGSYNYILTFNHNVCVAQTKRGSFNLN